MGTGVAALLIATFLSGLSLSFAQVCPSVSGYSFYQLQDIADAFVLSSLPMPTAVTDIAAACDSTPRCKAFTTTGQLLIAPQAPVFSFMDTSDSNVQACDGVYLAERSLSGLLLQDGVTADMLRQEGSKKEKDMQATQAAAQRVASKLVEKGIKPQDFQTVSKADLDEAFRSAKTPKAQSSDTSGSYSYSGLMAALTYPVWDSRSANGSYNYITVPKNQGSCGSCVAFAATAAAETAVAVGSKTSTVNTNDFSEQWLFFCNGKYSPTCNTGWLASQATDVILGSGIPSESNYPYVAKANCTLVSSPEQRPGGNFSRTVINDIATAKDYIRMYGAVLTYFAVYNDFFNWGARSQPYAWDGVSSRAGSHQVLCVGYNDTGAYWIAKNSWGTGWGDGGFFRFAYVNKVGFMSGASDNIIGLTWKPSGNPSPSPSPPPSSFCGDGTCNTGESCSTCPSDCGACTVCGDGVCSGGETCSTCLADCGIVVNGARTCCGDGVCSAGIGESCSTCSNDCGACSTCNNNRVCEAAKGETCYTSSSGCLDCGYCSGNYCGDGRCLLNKKYNEYCSNCPQDCGNCTTGQYCGDGVCSTARGENSLTCPRDCGKTRLSGISLGNAYGQGNGNGNGKGKSLRRALRGDA